MRPPRREGFVLVIVLVFTLLLASMLAAFLRRAAVDDAIVRNRDAAAEAQAAARGGVRLAITLLLEDRLQELSSDFRSDSQQDVWALASGTDLPLGESGSLRLRIEDAGARVNLNGLLDKKGQPEKYAELFLTTLLDRVIEEMPGRPEAKNYETEKLARNLLDYVDADDTRIEGGAEDDPYARRDPPLTVPSRPLLSLEELRGVDGFDGALIEGLRPYVTVYPWTRGASGINPNTAPPHVLALLFHGTGGDFELASEQEIKQLLKARDDGDLLCAADATGAACRSIAEAIPGEIFPPPTYTTDIFLVRSEARVGEVRHTIETVVDRTNPSAPQLLAWKVW